MLEASNNNELPVIPGKRYFTIGEVAELCDVKPHVLRYWEQEFPQLKPVKRRGNDKVAFGIELHAQRPSARDGENLNVSAGHRQPEDASIIHAGAGRQSAR